MHKRTIIYNLQKIANILDDYELHKDADKITFVMQKIAQIDINSQNDLKIINDKNNVPNDLLFYAASVTQGKSENPDYDSANYDKTLSKILSIKNNQYVIDNFPNIINNIDATIQKLKDKSNYNPDDDSSEDSDAPTTTVAPSFEGHKYESAPKPPGKGTAKISKDIKPLLKTLAKNKENLRKIKAIIAFVPGADEYMPILDLLISADTKEIEKTIDNLENDKIESITSLLKNKAVQDILKDQFKIDPKELMGLINE
jgi:hypothetical protein